MMILQRLSIIRSEMCEQIKIVGIHSIANQLAIYCMIRERIFLVSA